MTGSQERFITPGALPRAPRDLSLGVILLVVTAGLVTVVTIALAHWDVDRAVAGLFYSTDQGWFLNQAFFWKLLEDYGPLPGILFAGLALAGLLAGRVKPLAGQWRRFLWLVVLTAVIGPGLVVNVAVKDHWGRPRPRETVDFGGRWEYREFYQPGIPGKGKSFPCGHCSAGFLFLTLYFYPGKKRHIRRAGLAFGLFWGGLLSIARISQGAHFVTDTLWSFGLMSMVILTLQLIVLNCLDYWKTVIGRMSFPGKAIWSTIAGCLLLVVLLVFFSNRPFYQTEQSPLKISSTTTGLEIQTNFRPDSTQIMYLDCPQGYVRINSHGFGGANVEIDVAVREVRSDRTLLFYGRVDPQGFFMKLSHQVVVCLPLDYQNRLRVAFVEMAESGKVDGRLQ